VDVALVVDDPEQMQAAVGAGGVGQGDVRVAAYLLSIVVDSGRGYCDIVRSYVFAM
jgi:hypothetical protein